MWENNQTKFVKFLADKKANLEEKIDQVKDEIAEIKLNI